MLLKNIEKTYSPKPPRKSLPIMRTILNSAAIPSFQKASSPPPLFHLMDGDTPLVFMVEESRLFGVEPDFYAALKSGEATALEELGELLATKKRTSDFTELDEPTAISLNIAQSCNLSCSYCYADEGKFGGKSGLMTEETAFAAIDNLLAAAKDRAVTVGFIGGEPLVNRKVLHASVAYARQRARSQNTTVRFSVTTNATLLKPEDLDLFRENCFTVTVSLDGDEKINNSLRRSSKSSGSYAQALEALGPLLNDPGRVRLSARATITRTDLRIWERVEALGAAGFEHIGVSPLRHSPDPSLALSETDWPAYLKEMIRAGENELRRLRTGKALRFSNLTNALQQIHLGTNRNLPCGSAVNYVSVSARGEYFTCHRTVEDPSFALGDTAAGLSTMLRQEFLRGREVDKQEPCSSCWARYLCGGGCHAEVLSVGRGGCDYIRGWLQFCLLTYDRLLTEGLLPFVKNKF